MRVSERRAHLCGAYSETNSRPIRLIVAGRFDFAAILASRGFYRSHQLSETTEIALLSFAQVCCTAIAHSRACLTGNATSGACDFAARRNLIRCTSVVSNRLLP